MNGGFLMATVERRKKNKPTRREEGKGRIGGRHKKRRMKRLLIKYGSVA